MPHTTIKPKKTRTGYVPVKKHSQKKEHPATFVVSIRLPYGSYAAYKKLSIKDRNALRMHIQSFLKASTE